MDAETHSDDEYISAASPDEPVFTAYGGSGMFAGSQDFTIAGGIFNNSNYLAAPAAPKGCRMLPMGDIDLQRELIVNVKSGVVESQRERNCVRRVYSAKVIGRNSNLTVAIYQGDGAEEDWRRHTEMYMSLRHPNIIQTWAGASYGNVHATVFHGDLVPLRAFINRHSPIVMVYLWALYAGEWSRVEDYFQSLGMARHQWECTMWIRSPTGTFSVDLVPEGTGRAAFSFQVPPQISAPSDPSKVTEVIAIESLGLTQYHYVCYDYLDHEPCSSISASTTVNMGATIFWPSQNQYEEHVEIALLTEIDVVHLGWQGEDKNPELGQNRWSRYRASDVFHTDIVLHIYLFCDEYWLSQANHIFSRLGITSNLEDYKLLNSISFGLTIGDVGREPPAGFLFLCPMENFRTGPTSFTWPNQPAYWSLDPEGLEALSTEEAEHLGFPPLQPTTDVAAASWDTSAYAGLRKFHQAKGFDPDSQEVALHLGDPLFRLSRDTNSPFAHGHDWFAERSGEQGIDEDHKDESSTSTNDDAHEEDGECSFRNSNCEESGPEGNDGRVHRQLEACARPHDAPCEAAEAYQESFGRNSSSTDQKTHTDPEIVNERTTGGGYTRHLFRWLQQGLVTETDNIDIEPISSFLI